MSITVANVTTTTANAYVSSGNTAVTFLSLCNYSGANVTANVFVVPSGDTASNTNIVISGLDITTLDTYQFYVGPEKLVLANGDAIAVNCSANSSVTAVVSYINY